MPIRDVARAAFLAFLALGLSACERETQKAPSVGMPATLESVKSKGFVQCGVNQGLPGFSNTDDRGEWSGLDVDICRGIAAAIFGDPMKVKFTPLSTKERFTALQSGEVDVLSRNTTWTMGRDTSLGFNFAGINYHDGQGFMVRKSRNVGSGEQLANSTICAQTGTTTELNVADYFRSRNMPYEIVAFEKGDEAVQAYEKERCDVFTSDRSQLYAQRLKLSKPDDHVVLQDIISKEPLGPVVRQGDDQWLDIVRWTLNAMINAEELGVTSANADEMKASANPEVRRLLGDDKEEDFGGKIGLDRSWAYRIVKLVGNYGEIFERNVGQGSPLKIERGVNALWTKGGILYAPPIR